MSSEISASTLASPLCQIGRPEASSMAAGSSVAWKPAVAVERKARCSLLEPRLRPRRDKPARSDCEFDLVLDGLFGGCRCVPTRTYCGSAEGRPFPQPNSGQAVVDRRWAEDTASS